MNRELLQESSEKRLIAVSATELRAYELSFFRIMADLTNFPRQLFVLFYSDSCCKIKLNSQIAGLNFTQDGLANRNFRAPFFSCFLLNTRSMLAAMFPYNLNEGIGFCYKN
jgi:hypothetical protein